MANKSRANRAKLFHPWFTLVLGLQHKTYPARQKWKNFCFKLALGKPKIAVVPTPVEHLATFMQKMAPVSCGKKLIRLGSAKRDGGYLLPDDLNGVAACFSPGVGLNSEFELDVANQGIKVFMADASVEGPAAKHELFGFRKAFIGTKEDMVSLKQWINEELPSSSSQDDLILQIDIEGAEYHNFLDLPDDLLKRIRIIAMEAHNLELLCCQSYFEIVEAAFSKILRTHYCVHLHPNNSASLYEYKGLEIPPVMEITFLRKDRLGNHEPKALRDFPHELDVVNASQKPAIQLPNCWMKKN